MFTKNYYKELNISSKFKDPRYKSDGKTIDYYHSGIDFTANKLYPIKSLIDGVVLHKEENHKMYGNHIILKHNLSFLKPSLDVTLLTMHAHLHNLNVTNNDMFIKAGTVIGSMGNSGNCWTLDKDSWRKLTTEEQADPLDQRGVHLHFDTYVIEKKDNLINAMKKVIDLDEAKDMVTQWGKTYFNPIKVIEFLEKYTGV